MKTSVQVNGTLFPDISTFLFDLDGTLIDSLDLHIEAFQWILEKLGKEVSKAQLEPLMGRTPQDIISEFFDDMDREELLEAANEKEEKLAEIIEHVYVYPNIAAFLQKLQSLGVKTVVISSTHRKLVQILLDRAGLLDYLDDIVSGDEVRHGKPNPEPFLKGVEKAQSHPEQTIAIGDSIHDYHSATSAGVHFVGILTGKTDRQTFENAGLELIVEDITDFTLTQNV